MKGGLDPGTIISMADGQYISIESVRVGDEVLSYDFSTKKFKPSKVLEIWTVKKNVLYKIEAADALMCSEDFLIALKDGTIKPAKDIKSGDIIIDEYGHEETVENVSAVEGEMRVVGIKVEGKTFVADGFVVCSE